MRRGEIWSVSAGADYAGKPRPAVILQDDLREGLPSVTVCPITSSSADPWQFRVVIAPDAINGLRAVSRLMIDKVVTIPKKKMGSRIGTLSGSDLVQMERALIVFLGLSG